MHENMHINVNKNMFSFTFLNKFSWVIMTGNWSNKNILQLYFHVFSHLKSRSSSYTLQHVYSTLMVQMPFSQIQQAPGPDFRKVGKFLKRALWKGNNPNI